MVKQPFFDDEQIQRLPAHYYFIRTALIQDWDPIGVGKFGEAQEEYDAYIPSIFEMLKSGKSENEVFEYLWVLETQYMGLSGDRCHTRKFAHTICGLLYHKDLDKEDL